MKRILVSLSLLLACGGTYKAPKPVPSVALPTGAALKPYDSTKPGNPTPYGMAMAGNSVYVALGNIRTDYSPGGPGLLAAFVPSQGTVSLIDLNGSDEKQCQNATWVRALNGKLYVSCVGDFSSGAGAAIVEVDPGTNAVTRRVSLTVQPGDVAVVGNSLYFGDTYTGTLHAIDLGSFTVSSTTISAQCPTGGSYKGSIADLVALNGELYALCSNDSPAVLSRIDPASGTVKGTATLGPIATAMTVTGDNRLAVVNAGDNTLSLVTPTASGVTAQVALHFSTLTKDANLQDVRARDNFVFTVASGNNTVQKIDLNAQGGPAIVAEVNVGDGATPWNILPLDDMQAIVSNQVAGTVTAVQWPK